MTMTESHPHESKFVSNKAWNILVDNEWRPATEGNLLSVVNPSNGQEFARIARGKAEDIDAAVMSARRAIEGAWGRMPATERGRLLTKLASAVQDHHDELVELESLDTGKQRRQADADITALARYFEFYGGAADKITGDTIPYRSNYVAMTFREPYGVSAHIIPWNYPSQIAGRSLGAGLAMGNAVVVKPAEDACLSVLKIGELARDVGFPPGAVNIVSGYGEEAGAALSAHPGVDHISFTGSPDTGSLVQMAAARNNRPVTMELGGKSPQILFADADLDAALPFLVNSIIQHAGQTCSAGSRLIVERSLYAEVLQKLSERFNELMVGSSDMDLDCGPVISQTQLNRIEGFLSRAAGEGLLPCAEGRIAQGTPGGGFYSKPALFSDISPAHELAQAEVFGPVLVVLPFDTEAEAIRIANDTEYGLVAGVWTKDGSRQMRLSKALAAGQVFVNCYGAGGGVELPFGGVKKSGFGREKGFEALHAFSTLKTVVLQHN